MAHNFCNSVFGIIGLFLYGCSSVGEITRQEPQEGHSESKYTVIYYIHADAGYLFHDSDGIAVHANEKVLEKAFELAKEAKSGEMLIFYQRPEKNLLGLIPLRKSKFYHFLNGQEITRIKYRHSDKKEDFLTTEAQIFKKYRYRSSMGAGQSYFLYFGHEIPENEGKNYHKSLPDIKVNTETFAEGLQRFLLPAGKNFDLVILSTCNNGTPAMVEHLMPFTEYLLASPQNLHLSHIDIESIRMLESTPAVSAKEIANSMARQTYLRLTSHIQTTITLSVYDFKYVRNYVTELGTLAATSEVSPYTNFFQGNIDCTNFSFFDASKYKVGVETWHKPARFGRNAYEKIHSGWGCKQSESN